MLQKHTCMHSIHTCMFLYALHTHVISTLFIYVYTCNKYIVYICNICQAWPPVSGHSWQSLCVGSAREDEAQACASFTLEQMPMFHPVSQNTCQTTPLACSLASWGSCPKKGDGFGHGQAAGGGVNSECTMHLKPESACFHCHSTIHPLIHSDMHPLWLQD